MPITKQTIAIIGAASNIGSAVAQNVAGGNYRLLLFDRDVKKLEKLADNIRQPHPNADISLMDCAHGCGWEADIIVMAIPHHAEKEIAKNIRDVATQKVVVSISNPITVDTKTSAAEELQQWLPHSKVVKAFNTTLAASFKQPVINGKQVDTFIAGDDEDALEMVTELVETAGFNPVIVGGLSASNTLERMHIMLMRLTTKKNAPQLVGWKILQSH